MNDFILIVDDNQGFINELRAQANALKTWKDNCFLICFGQDDIVDVLQHHAQQITAVFLDFDMRDQDGKPFGAEQFMEATQDYLDWDKVRCFWFSGDEDLDQARIQQAKAKYSRIDTAYIRKPFSFLQLVARLENADIPQWQGFPLPLRVINKQAQVIYSNEHWRTATNEPAPELFVKEGEFDEGERDFYGRHPDGNITDYPKFTHFRLVSSVNDDGQYLLQFAQSLEGLEPIKERNQLHQLIEKICLALNGHGFKRVRLYRYYSMPRYYEENQEHEDTQIKGFMSLYYTNTPLRFNKLGKQSENPDAQNYASDSCVTSERGIWIREKIKELSKQSENLIYHIDNNPKPIAPCDINAIPEDAENIQSILKMPLITQFKEIKDITKQNLLGLLVIDRYEEKIHRYTTIIEEDVKRLEHTLLAYCRALTYSLEQEIKDNDIKTKIEYTKFDKEFLKDLQNPEQLLKHLLDKAIKTSGASVGYIAEQYQSDNYKNTVSTDHKLFHGYVFSNQAVDIPVVRCWKTGKRIALPNLREEAEITKNVAAAYNNEKMVWQNEKDTIIPDSEEIRSYLKNEIGSLVELPVFVNNEQVAAITLHAKQPHHFNYEKLSNLDYLITRVGLILMISRQIQQRQLFLDGVIHEIKSDISPLKQALNSLDVNKHNTIYLRAQYCATRLDMASKNLLLMTQDKELDLTKVSCLSKVLSEVSELYQQDINDKKIDLIFEPEQDNIIWSTPITMSIEWLTHIVANLLDNAVKYTKRDTITISAQSNSQQFILQVINSGNMSEQELVSVFNADYRSKQGSGFHVGLASCKKIMQAHQGDIELNNIAGKIQVTVTWLLANSKTSGEQS